jgi:hypothetical protein
VHTEALDVRRHRATAPTKADVWEKAPGDEKKDAVKTTTTAGDR